MVSIQCSRRQVNRIDGFFDDDMQKTRVLARNIVRSIPDNWRHVLRRQWRSGAELTACTLALEHARTDAALGL